MQPSDLAHRGVAARVCGREVSPTPCAGCVEALAADGLQVVELLGAAEVGRQDLNHFDCLDFALGSANHAHVRVAL
jgi:hypothetical protein